MKKIVLVAILFTPILSNACGSLEYWADKYLKGKSDKYTMLSRMNSCLNHNSYKGIKNDLKMYNILNDALENPKLLRKRDTKRVLSDIFYKSNCLVSVQDLDYYEDIKEYFGYDCKVKKYLKVNSKNGVNLRDKPSSKSKRVLSLSDEEVVLFIKSEKDWIKIKYERRDITGYVHKSFLEKDM